MTVEAIVGVALRAVLASVVLGGVLTLVVLIATRALALTAAARHLLWTTALFAMGLMPLAGIGVSLSRGAAPPAAHEGRAAIAVDAGMDGAPTSISGRDRSTGTSAAYAAASHASAAHISAAQAAPVQVTERVTGGVAASAVDRLASARDVATAWRPRVSHSLALGAVVVWAIGVLAGIGGLVASIVRVRGLKRRSSPLDGTLPDELPWLTEIGPGREIYLRLSYETETPVAIGFGRPVILIPTELATAAGLSAIEPLILHEHAHLRRYDDWTNLAQRAIERLFWFNPIVWLVGRRIALEREIASDDAVVEKTGEAHRYATSLWKLAREMRMPEHAVVAPGALLTRKQISVRIEQLLDANRARRHGSPAAAAGVSLAAVLAVGLVATSAPAVELPAPPATVAGTTPSHRDLPPNGTRQRASVHVHVPRIASLPPRPVSPVASLPRTPWVAPRAQRGPSGRHAVVMIAGDAGRLVRDAMASIPVQIARENQAVHGAHRVVPGGVKVTRELIASCTACTFEHADLRGLDLHGLRIEADTLSGADLRNANLAGAQLVGVSLANANLGGADLRGAQLSGVALEGATFDGARLDGMRLVGVSLQRVSLRAGAVRGVLANCTGCDMQGMDLRGQDLHDIVLTGADLSEADLRDANLSGARFTAVDLSNARLDGADLTDAGFVSCDFSGASLRNAKTTGMTLHGSGFDG